MNQALTELNQELLAAHEQGDLVKLVALYKQAGELMEQQGDLNAACFYLTHAFVFALEAGSPEAPLLNALLVERGRAHLLQF
ncbi:hypothetical protein [Leisingera sp. ANG59]|uniref:hypothetical protein n=1 Tax=Leisingera sp. ANG59 TaxID=2675221 RepID=UPI00157246E7|nr:hypothetical protein [Leisingera sp. ANG59]NSY39342.1 hypothetical protein [Leisingera sp. ANG59]